MNSIMYSVESDGVAILKINRPGSMNALDWEAMGAFAEAVEQAHDQDGLGALVLHGAGTAFCAGGDLYELDAYPSLEDGQRLSTLMGSALERLEALPVPTLAAIEGPALGGGAEVALSCDIRIMAEHATLGMMHIRLGITPAWGGGQRLLRLAGYARALEWLCLGEVLSAEEAHEYGLANRMVPEGQALGAALDMARSIARQDLSAVMATKRLLRAGLSLSPEEAAQVEGDVFAPLWAAPAHLKASARFVARREQKSNHRAP